MFVTTEPEAPPVAVGSPAPMRTHFRDIVHVLHDVGDGLIRDANHHELRESALQQVLSS